MLSYREVQKIEQELVSITCDICGKVYDADDFEIQELLNVLGEEEEISWTKIKMNDEDLDGYIDEIIDDIDATELEDFL